ncbi:T9SS type A sorting domain-containing protein [candidate division KSB1 bacterium]
MATTGQDTLYLSENKNRLLIYNSMTFFIPDLYDLGDINADGNNDVLFTLNNLDGDNECEILYGKLVFDVGDTINFDEAGITKTKIDMTNYSGTTRSLVSGDFNGDGIVDLLYPAFDSYLSMNNQYSNVFAIFGSQQLSEKSIFDPANEGNVLQIISDNVNNEFGYRVTAGDINADGYDDIIIGVNDENPRIIISNGSSRLQYPNAAGAVYIFYGKADEPTGVKDNEPQNLSSDFTIHNSYPNPFNPATTIEYSVPHTGHMRIDVYNILGQKVRTLVNDAMPTGNHLVLWDGRNEFGMSVSGGVYLVRMVAGNKVASRKILMVK